MTDLAAVLPMVVAAIAFVAVCLAVYRAAQRSDATRDADLPAEDSENATPHNGDVPS